jgi:uncharacterized RDD family membrane protein YckC
MPPSEQKLDTLQSIELAEGVEIRLRIAGPFLRILAWILDTVLIFAVLMVMAIIMGIGGYVVGEQVVQGVLMLVWFGLSWWYPVICEVSPWGATLGKKVCGLRVMQPSGAPVAWSQAIVRNFLRVVDINPPFFGIPGIVSCLSTARFQRLGDLAAGTVVVYERGEVAPEASGPPPLQTERPMVALRPEESRAIVTFRERAVFWSDARRIEIADQLQVLTGKKGAAGVTSLTAMAHWLQEKR